MAENSRPQGLALLVRIIIIVIANHKAIFCAFYRWPVTNQYNSGHSRVVIAPQTMCFIYVHRLQYWLTLYWFNAGKIFLLDSQSRQISSVKGYHHVSHWHFKALVQGYVQSTLKPQPCFSNHVWPEHFAKCTTIPWPWIYTVFHKNDTTFHRINTMQHGSMKVDVLRF